jgi:pentatricopeptide repeat protein
MLQDPRSLLQQAEEHRRSGRLKEAIAVCLEGLSRHPDLDAVRVTLGRAYLESGRNAEASEALRRVFERHPDHHLAGKLLAEALKRLGDVEGAAAACREILRHYPRDREVEGILASIEVPREEAERAHAAPSPARLPVAASSDPPPDYLPEDVAPAALAPGPASGATGPVIRPPGDALQTNTLADLYLKQGLVHRALEVYRGMLRLDPGNDLLRRRVEELERRGAPGAPSQAVAEIPGRGPEAKGQAAPGEEARIVPGSVRPAAPGRDGAAIERLARWLDAIHSGWEGAGKTGAPR